MNNIAIVTGATSGFGKAIAEELASHQYNLIITGRRADRLQALCESLQSNHAIKCRALVFDVRSMEETTKAFASLDQEWMEVDVLINNAGLALGRESIEAGALEDWNAMIDTNVKGLLHVTKVISPHMVRRKRGTIINIGSVAGRQPYAGGNVYSATKYAVDGLTHSMRIDLAPYGVRVGQIAPGAAETEFSIVRFHSDQSKAEAVYHGFHPLSAQDIADTVWFMVSRPPHVTIQDVLIMPTAQPTASIIHRAV